MPTPFDLDLGDFHFSEHDDPLRVDPAFHAWRHETSEHQSLYERPLAGPVGPRGRLQTPAGPVDVINMASLDYLGYAGDDRIRAAQVDALETWGNGAGGVPLLSGTTLVHRRLEHATAELVRKESAMSFTSGFAAAIGLAVGVLRRGDVAVCDERAHISWMDAVKLSGARLETFAHDDPADLVRVLSNHRGRRRVVIVDGLYSMDGDLADLPALLDVCDDEDVGMIVDEAHSMFAAGPGGGGAVDHYGVADRVRIVMGTYSKAMGLVGGFLAGDTSLLEYVRYYAHPYVFSCALPPSVAAGALEGMRITRAEPERRQRLWDNAAYFRDRLASIGIDTGRSSTWVVPIVVGKDRRLLYESARELMQLGLYVAPVDYPAVSQDALRLRSAVSAAHTREDLDHAVELIERVVARRLRAAS